MCKSKHAIISNIKNNIFKSRVIAPYWEYLLWLKAFRLMAVHRNHTQNHLATIASVTPTCVLSQIHAVFLIKSHLIYYCVHPALFLPPPPGPNIVLLSVRLLLSSPIQWSLLPFSYSMFLISSLHQAPISHCSFPSFWQHFLLHSIIPHSQLSLILIKF